MPYIPRALNHFKAIQAWAQTCGAATDLDVRTFELEIKARNRFFRLHPQFLAINDGRFLHSAALGENTEGFIGWLPYRPVSWDLTLDKRVFKAMLAAAGLPTPATSLPSERRTHPYVLKAAKGSFGDQLAGPYASTQSLQTRAELPRALRQLDDTVFAEQFIEGRNLKLWLWGATPVYAHLHAYPRVEGDGTSTARQLAQRLMGRRQFDDDSTDAIAVRSSLAYQGVAPDESLARGKSVWIDYRYGRYITDTNTALEDNALPGLEPSLLEQARQMGALVGREVERMIGPPILTSVDGVVDANDRIWWLELNTNPMTPPPVYPYIFETLFDVSVRRPAESEAHVPAPTAEQPA